MYVTSIGEEELVSCASMGEVTANIEADLLPVTPIRVYTIAKGIVVWLLLPTA